MKIKLISDGTMPGTQVVNAETGERIEGVVDCKILINSATDWLPVAFLTVKHVYLEAVVEMLPENIRVRHTGDENADQNQEPTRETISPGKE